MHVIDSILCLGLFGPDRIPVSVCGRHFHLDRVFGFVFPASLQPRECTGIRCHVNNVDAV